MKKRLRKNIFSWIILLAGVAALFMVEDIVIKLSGVVFILISSFEGMFDNRMKELESVLNAKGEQK